VSEKPRSWAEVRASAAVGAALLVVLVGLLGCNRPVAPTTTPTAAEAGPEFLERSTVWSNANCVVEHVAFSSQGYRILGWIVTPISPGPFPLFVFNHGSNVGADQVDRSDQPVWGPQAGCYSYMTDNHWIVFLPEGRGYAGSEGPTIGDVLHNRLAVMQFLHGRAMDVTAGVAILENDPNVRRDCTVIAGASHGGVVSLLAAAERPYQGVIAQSSGASYYNSTTGLSDMIQAIHKIDAPILLQHAANDTLVPPAVSTQLAEAAKRDGKMVEFMLYPGLPGVEGHFLMSPSHTSVWKSDTTRLFANVLAACP
jgi:dipeptidyl aminopeptidase/acylaminoacyl peptidase